MSLALRKDGTVVGWGSTSYGALDIPADLTDAVAVSGGDIGSIALRSNGTVVAWGSMAQPPADLKDVTAIAAGSDHSVALRKDGSVVAWGGNDYFQSSVPGGVTGATGVAAGGYFSAAMGPVPVFTRDAPPTSATVGESYSYTFATSGPAARFPQYWDPTGTLPDGLAVSSDGVLSGTPTTAGEFTFTVAARNAYGVRQSASHTITVAAAGAPTITGTAPGGTVGEDYDFSYGVTGTPAVSVLSGPLPPGLTLDATGRLSGTPTTAGTSTFTVQAENSAGTAQTTSTITIAPSSKAPVFTADSPPSTATAGRGYSYTFATSGAAATFSVASGSLPDGLTLGSGGELSGAPTTTGSSTFAVAATNVYGTTVGASHTITAGPASVPATLSGDAPAGTVGSGYDYGYTVGGTPAPETSLQSGALPPGLTLSTSGRLSGTPTAAGTYSFTVQATSSAGTARVTDSITIAAAASISGDAPAGAVGAGYDFGYTVEGTPAPTVSLLSGSLPPGIILSPSGRLTGTPTTEGTYSFLVKATGSAGTAQIADSITVSSAPVTPVAPSVSGVVAAGMVGSPYDYTYTVTGTPAPTVTLKSGTLPTGLTLDPSGRLSGTPTTAGTYTFTVKATNSTGAATAQSTLTVSPKAVTTKADLSVDLAAPTTAGKGKTYVYTVTTKNTGPATSSTVYTKVILPPNTQFVSATGKYTRIGNLVIFQRSSLTKGQTMVDTITVKATGTGKGTALATTFSVKTPDPSIRTNSDTTATTTR